MLIHPSKPEHTVCIFLRFTEHLDRPEHLGQQMTMVMFDVCNDHLPRVECHAKVISAGQLEHWFVVDHVGIHLI